AVADVDGAHAAAGDPGDGLQDGLGLGCGKGAGGLVQDEQSGAGSQGTGDLHELLLGQGQFTDPGVGGDVDTEFGEDLLRTGLHGSVVDASVSLGPGAEVEVLRGRQLRHQAEFLVAGSHSEFGGPADSALAERSAIDLDPALVGCVHAGQQADQGGCAGTAASQESTDRSGSDVEVGPVQCRDPGVILGGSANAGHDLGVGCRCGVGVTHGCSTDGTKGGCFQGRSRNTVRVFFQPLLAVPGCGVEVDGCRGDELLG